jgi:diketogulonate reductase-like aldo/keto reductase
MGGCIHEDLVNAPCPRSAAEYPSGVQRNEFAAAVHAMGGWMAVQKALVAVKQIADNHGVSMTAVMLRWQMDLGVTPVVRISWDDPHGALCMVQGKNVSKGGAALFQRESFLDEEDMKTLQSLYK